jgi:transposase
MRDTPAMLRELKVVEQRYQAVLQVLDGIPVTEVAKRFGVARQTVHRWVARYRDSGIEGLADRSGYRVKTLPSRLDARDLARLAAAGAAPPGRRRCPRHPVT